ncbi:MAG: hypothetical protein AAF750_08570 [Planctomycetota bacterium]
MSQPKYCEAMIGWWWATLTTTGLIFLLFPLHHPAFAAVGLGLITLNLTGMLICLYLAARTGGPPGYASRQLLLAVLLLPAFFIGFFFVPWLFRSDLQKWAEPTP